ncbi:hypothetical protein D6777_04095 [Candidatus Woesearchaeota archaeon]|nr:MAG: hypothetical protein D6777_04095 [Candidatus Woesearchaeota archaeon]
MKLFEEFQAFRRILCICPCCGEIKRLSDLKLTTKEHGPDTWLDKFEKKERLVEKKEEAFEKVKEELRKKSVERGQKEAEKIFRQAINPELRSLRLDPKDMTPILNPVDFIVFKGMVKTENVSDIIFLSKHISNSYLNSLRRQVKKAIDKRNYDWKLVRISNDGSIKIE